MSAKAQLDDIFNSFITEGVNEDAIKELKSSFNEDHVEVFLEKLESMDNIDRLISTNDTFESENKTNQFIDFISRLVLNLK